MCRPNGSAAWGPQLSAGRMSNSARLGSALSVNESAVQGIQMMSDAAYLQTVPSAPDPIVIGSAPVLLPV